ncbi:MAG TPA: helix-turn-helix domain-containing protein [Abditibacteriaceae bacterium]|nr:helix-turn-helix domain-containing protein [Abditibacteriaceae bacterium]
MARAGKTQSTAVENGKTSGLEDVEEAADQRALDRLICERQVQIAKAMANARRMEIVHLLHSSTEPLEAATLLERTGISKANLSQQMSVLVSVGMVEALRERSRDGSRVRYRLTTPRFGEACQMLRDALFERMEHEGELARQRQR